MRTCCNKIVLYTKYRGRPADMCKLMAQPPYGVTAVCHHMNFVAANSAI